ncbi:MAG TPA: GNAT family N-acetyltransferase [Acidimicrobiales bacterium]
MTVMVREASVDDIDELMALRREVAGEGRWIAAELPLDEEGDRRTLTEGAERGSLFVAEVDGALVGVLGLHLPPYLVADLGMNVKDGFRGQGVGSALMERAIEWARDAGSHKIALQHWPHNDAAHALYLKFGFEQEGYLRRQYPRKNGEIWDAVLMGLLIDP